MRTLLATALLILAGAAHAAAQQPGDGLVTLRNGDAKIALTPGWWNRLTTGGVSLGPIRPVEVNPGYEAIEVPIAGGRLDPRTGRGVTRHEGGFVVGGPGGALRLRDIRIDVRGRRLTAEAAGGRFTLGRLDVSGTRVLRRGPGGVGVFVVRMELVVTPEGARVVNRAIGRPVLFPGARIARVDIRSTPAEVWPRDGTTRLTVAPAFRAALDRVGADLEPTGRADAAPGGGIALPIAGGLVWRGPPLGGGIRHAGGLAVGADGARVVLRGPLLALGHGGVWADLADGGRARVMRESRTPDTRVGLSSGRLVITELALTLSPRGARILNARLPGGAFAAGVPVGTIRVVADLASRPTPRRARGAGG